MQVLLVHVSACHALFQLQVWHAGFGEDERGCAGEAHQPRVSLAVRVQYQNLQVCCFAGVASR